MQDELHVNVDEISAVGLGSLVSSVVAVAAADGDLAGEEHQVIQQNLSRILGDAEMAETLTAQALNDVVSRDRETIFAEARDMLDGEGRETCFTIACAIAARAGGIGTKEGIALQLLAKTLEIGYPSAKYNELLGKGMRLGRA